MGRLEPQYSKLVGEPRVGYLSGTSSAAAFGSGWSRPLGELASGLGDLGRLYAGFLNDKTDEICSNYAARCREAIDSYVKGDGTYDMDKINASAWQERRKEILQQEIDHNGGNYNRKRLQMYVEKMDMHNDGYLGKIYRTQEFAAKKAHSQEACNGMQTNFRQVPSQDNLNAYGSQLNRHFEMIYSGNATEKVLAEIHRGLEKGEFTIGGKTYDVIDDVNGTDEEKAKAIENYRKSPEGKRLRSEIDKLISVKENNVKLQREYVQAHMDQAAWAAFSDKLKSGSLEEAKSIIELDGIGETMRKNMQTQFQRQMDIKAAGEEGRAAFWKVLESKEIKEGGKDKTGWERSDGGKYWTPEMEKAAVDGLAEIDTAKPNGELKLQAYKEAMRLYKAQALAAEEADIDDFTQQILNAKDGKARASILDMMPESRVKDKMNELNNRIALNEERKARQAELENKIRTGQTLKLDEKAEKIRLETKKENMTWQALYDYGVLGSSPRSLAVNRDRISDKDVLEYHCRNAGITDRGEMERLYNYVNTPQGKYEIELAKMLVTEINGSYTGGGKMGKTLQLTQEEISKVMPELVNLACSLTPYTEWKTKNAQQVNGGNDALLKNAIRRMMVDLKVRKEPKSDERIPLGQWIVENRRTWEDMDEESVSRGKLLFEACVLADYYSSGNDKVYREIVKQIFDQKFGYNGRDFRK